jgi:hypothetical protein
VLWQKRGLRCKATQREGRRTRSARAAENIFDFITQGEINDLPDDDPQSAFTAFVRIPQISIRRDNRTRPASSGRG